MSIGSFWQRRDARKGQGRVIDLKDVKGRSVQFASCSHVQKPVVVSSHERSGTHFLINSVALNSVFVNRPLLEFDSAPFGPPLNFADPGSIGGFFARLLAHRCSSIVKSHFAVDFFLDEAGDLVIRDLCKVLYIARDPVDVMLSLNRFVNYVHWNEGPKGLGPLEFARAAPEGRMLRYQHRQAPSMIERWRHHVSGWTRQAERNPNVLVVSYRDLDGDFERTMTNVLAFLGCDPPNRIQRPDGIENTVHVPVRGSVPPAERAALKSEVTAVLDDEEMAKWLSGLLPSA